MLLHESKKLCKRMTVLQWSFKKLNCVKNIVGAHLKVFFKKAKFCLTRKSYFQDTTTAFKTHFL